MRKFNFLSFLVGAVMFFGGVITVLAQPTFTIVPQKDACAPNGNGSFIIRVTSIGTVDPSLSPNARIFGPTGSALDITAPGDYAISGLKGSGGANNYLIVITDDNGFTNVNATVKLWPAVSVALTSKTDVTTCTPFNGAIDITPSGGSGTYTYAWSGPGGFTATTQDISALGPGNYSVTVNDPNTVCTATSGSITINIASPSITLGAIPSVCSGTTSSSLSYGPTAGSPNEYSIDWDATANGAGLSDVGFVPLPASPIPINNIPTVVTTTTFNGTLTARNTTTGCFTSSNPISVTVNAVPTITGTLTICGTGTTQLTGSGTAAAATPWVSATPAVATVDNTGLVTGVSAGTSVITYTDNNGCQKTATVTVNAVPTITGTLTICGTGTTQLTGSGTAAAATPWVSATPAVATVDNTGLVTGVSAGTSVITYTDNNGCQKTATVTVNAVPTITGTLTICGTGTTQLTGSGTAAAATPWVSATPAVATVDNTGLVTGVSAGTSVITYTDNNGCQKTATVTVDFATITGTLTICGTTGTTQLTGSGTAAAATPWVSATPAVATVDNTGLVTAVSAGTTVITYTDTNGCQQTATVTVNGSPTITGTLTICGTGTTQLTGSGTAAAATPWVSATPAVATVDNTGLVTGVSAGTSVITYTDNNGCQKTITITVNATPTITGTATICVNATTQLTGSGTAAAATPWVSATPAVATVDNTGLVTGVSGGTSMITYTDNNGCQKTATITVNPLPVPTVVKTDASCSGATNGKIDVTGVTGTAGPWSYSIDGGTTTQATTSFPNLTTGNYSVVVSDNITGCASTPVPVTINATVVILPTIEKTDASCNGVSNGKIDVTSIAGGSAPYSYSKDNGSTFQTPSSTFSGLAGSTNYSIIVKDNSGCKSSVNTIFIANTATISGTVNKTDVSSCVGNDGSIQITSPSGGTAPYDYSIDNGANFFPTSTFGTLVPGNYNVVIRDAGLCKSSAVTITIGTISNIVPVIGKTDATCAGKTDGSIAITSVTGGTAPYTYSISNGAAGTFAAAGVTSFNSLAGNSNFSVVAKDANGCLSSAISIIINNTIVITGLPSTINTSCAGNDGTITITPSGGTTYTYSLDGGSFVNSNSFNNVSVGNHTVVVQDVSTCQSSSLPVTVNSNSNIIPTISKVDATCNGVNDGSITIPGVTGGVGPYKYSIDNGTNFVNPNSFTNLAAGNYSILVRDANLCVSSVSSVTLNNSTSLSASVQKISDETCAGGDGQIKVASITGGTGPYTYSSNNGATFGSPSAPPFSFTSLTVGAYNVVVKDNSGCLSTAQLISISLNCSGGPGSGGTGACATVVIVPQPTAATCTNSDGKVVFNITPAVPAVNNTGVKISITGTSSTNLTISRTNFNNFTFNNLPIGTYSYSIEYGDPSCTKTGQVTVDQSGTVGTPVASNPIDATCFGSSTGSVTIDVPGETGNLLEWSIDGVSWSTFTAGNQINGIPAGTGPLNQRVISVRRNSSDPCFAAVTVVIGQPADLALSYVTTDATCANNDGGVQINSVSGGTGTTYTYQFDGASTPNLTFSGLAGGAHTFSVKDVNLCTKNFPMTVNYPGLVNFTVTPYSPDCSGLGTNGSVDVTVTSSGNFDVGITSDPNANPNVFQTLISTGSTTTNFPGLSQGRYYVVARPSGALCPSKSPVDITGGPVAVDFTLSAKDFVCFETKGDIDITGIKGSSLVDYSYEVLNSGNVVASGTITQAQTLAAVQLTGLDNGDYQMRLFQNQSACPTPITSSYKTFKIKGPAASLDTLYVHRQVSLPNSATGSMLIGVQESMEQPYMIKLQLVTPHLQGQTNPNAFDSVWVKAVRNNQNLVVEYNATNLYPGSYRLYLKDTLGCTRTYDLDLNYDTDLFIPNIFTPNNDTRNDKFYILNVPDKATMLITNRWGKEVYTTTDYKSHPWNGGAESDGIYYYTLTIGSKKFTGWVELLHPSSD